MFTFPSKQLNELFALLVETLTLGRNGVSDATLVFNIKLT